MVQYTVNRNVDGTNIQSSISFIDNQFMGYKNFSNAGSEYTYFFQWFKYFEDLENKNNRESQKISHNIDEMMQISKISVLNDKAHLKWW